jgi:hypothetical protein
VFLDPIADIAVLTETDDHWEEFNALVAPRRPFAVADIGNDGARAWLMSLAGKWTPCRARPVPGGALVLSEASIVGGMSGSPIVLDNGAAIGVVALGHGGGVAELLGKRPHTEGGPEPRLACHLPGWLLNDLKLTPGGGLEERRAWAAAEMAAAKAARG